MSARERMRLDALSRVKRQELTVVEAAELMRVSLRQARRLWKRFKAGGAGGLVHRLRGRVSNRRLPEEFRDQVVRRHQARYADFGPTLACEKLAEEGLGVSPDTLTSILQERHLWRAAAQGWPSQEVPKASGAFWPDGADGRLAS